ncbi:class I SAM-dependent methyltransferase [Allosalinactinospora lopnorensis]|uniref:class I SAM-dependent methyltransferase n=1 Tax=Allosalinactinospora lopnorensis TaxID=1352348 RepID=UPI0009E3DF81|nr:class I SAM-dependent methyltransferase [Allosalinactinospora lopnorensis]
MPGAVPSPNIWNSPRVYELENNAVDPDQVIDAAMRGIRTMEDAHVLDIGCGTGYHLPRFAVRARRVTGVEPHTELAAAARSRADRLANITVYNAVAQRLPLPDASVEVAHARWAYFFGRGCEPGLAELRRVMRRGGVAFVIDNDATRSTFGGWFRRFLPGYDPHGIERFWSAQGFQREPLTMRWLFERRADFEAVVRIEFPPDLAEEIIASHPGLEVDYAVNLWWREY